MSDRDPKAIKNELNGGGLLALLLFGWFLAGLAFLWVVWAPEAALVALVGVWLPMRAARPIREKREALKAELEAAEGVR